MKKVVITLVILGGICAAWVIAFPNSNPFKKWFSKTDDGSTASGKNTTTGTAQPVSTTTATSTGSPFIQSNTAVTKDSRGFPLSVGSTGKYVSMIQEALNKRFGSSLAVDGILGSKTAKALSANGFNPDAIYYKHFNDIVGYQYWG
jgi:hypothetical protein